MVWQKTQPQDTCIKTFFVVFSFLDFLLRNVYQPTNPMQKHTWKFFVPLIAISFAISWLQWNSGAESLKFLALHMLFHAIFFIGLWIESVGNFFANQSRGIMMTLLVLGLVTILQAGELLHPHVEEHLLSPWVLVSVIVLLIIQNVILHHMNKVTGTCSTLCHITKFHITGDILIVTAVLGASLFASVEVLHTVDVWFGVLILLGMWAIFLRHVYRSVDA